MDDTMRIAPALPEVAVAPPGPRAREVLAADRRRFGTWPSRPYPLVVDHARGVTVTDVDGNRYLDVNGLMGINVLGHSHPAVVRAVAEQVGRGANVGISDHGHPLAAELADELLRRLPGFAYVILANSGGEAVDWAVRLARAVTGRDLVVTLEGSYHGATSLGWELSEVTPSRHGATERAGVVHVRPEDLDPGRLAAVVDRERVAAVVLEPIVGAAVRPLGRAEAEAVAALRREFGILAIADEIQTGGHRTGPFVAAPDIGLDADLVTLSKAITGGLPLAAIAVRSPHVVFEKGGHGSSFGGNLVACAAALATLRELEAMGAEARVRDIGERFGALLEKLVLPEEGVAEIRGRGAIWGVQLADGVSAAEVAGELFRRGVLALVGDGVLRLLPPYVVTDEQLEVAAEAVGRSVRAVAG